MLCIQRMVGDEKDTQQKIDAVLIIAGGISNTSSRFLLPSSIMFLF